MGVNVPNPSLTSGARAGGTATAHTPSPKTADPGTLRPESGRLSLCEGADGQASRRRSEPEPEAEAGRGDACPSAPNHPRPGDGYTSSMVTASSRTPRNSV